MPYFVKLSANATHFKIGDLVGWREKIANMQRSAEPFDSVTDGTTTSDPPGGSEQAIRHRLVELSRIFRDGRALLDPRVAPEHLALRNPSAKTIADMFYSMDGICIVSRALRDLLDELDPGLHQTLPITLDGSPQAGERFLLNVHFKQDSIIDEGTNARPRPGAPAGDREVMLLTAFSQEGDVAVDLSLLGQANAWRERRYPGPLLLSDRLRDEVKRRKLRVPPLLKCATPLDLEAPHGLAHGRRPHQQPRVLKRLAKNVTEYQDGRWLRGRPRGWAVVVAARAALRATPLMAMGDSETVLVLGLPFFRATGIARFAAQRSDWSPEFGAVAHAAVGAGTVAAQAATGLLVANAKTAARDDQSVTARVRAGNANNAARMAHSAAHAAVGAVAHAAYGVAAFPDAFSATYCAADAAYYAAEAAAERPSVAGPVDFARERFRRAVEFDRNLLLEGMELPALARSPLWSAEPDRWITGKNDAWRQALRELGGDWPIWFDWYSSQLEGRPSFDLSSERAAEIDERLALASDDWWGRPPAEINAEVKGWVAMARLHG